MKAIGLAGKGDRSGCELWPEPAAKAISITVDAIVRCAKNLMAELRTAYANHFGFFWRADPDKGEYLAYLYPCFPRIDAFTHLCPSFQEELTIGILFFM
mgnify:CR=1 FL=1